MKQQISINNKGGVLDTLLITKLKCHGYVSVVE